MVVGYLLFRVVKINIFKAPMVKEQYLQGTCHLVRALLISIRVYEPAGRQMNDSLS